MRTLFTAVLPLVLAASLQGAVFPAPVPVSPGDGTARSVTAQRCPTFSWSGVPGAWGYEIAVFSLGEEADAFAIDPQSGDALLRVTIPAQASSWTPSLEHCLAAGSRYAWFVRESGGPGRSGGNWSGAASFEVGSVAAVAPWSDEEMARLIERWMRSASRDRNLPAAQNAIIDDVKSVAEAARDRATEARDRATEARERAREARDKATAITNWVGPAGELADVKAVAASLKELFDEAARLLRRFSGSAAGGPETLGTHSAQMFEDAKIKGLYEDAIDMVRFFATEQAAGYESFVASSGGERCGPGSPCAIFRAELKALLEDVEELMDAVSDLRPEAAGPRMELDPLISLFEQIPPRMIYPIYRMNEAAGLIDRLGDLRDTATELRRLAPLFTEIGASSVRASGESTTTPLCERLAGKEDALRIVSYSIQAVAVAIKMTGKVMQGLGETKFGGAVGPAVVTGKIQASPLMTAGNIFWGVGDAIFAMGASAIPVLNNCRLLGRFADVDAELAVIKAQLPDTTVIDSILTAVEEITPVGGQITDHDAATQGRFGDVDTALTGLDTHLSSIDTHVGQAGAAVAAVGTALGAHDGNLTAIGTLITGHDQKLVAHELAVSTALGELRRATEGLQERFDALESASIIRIERQLAACEPLVSLYLPAAHGGQAEVVAELVRDSIDRAAAAGVKTNSAEVHYDRAEKERDDGEFVKAFGSLCRSYDALTAGG